ncbi:lipopolysaccharide biosynthesis protein RfbH [Sinanaerobacter chloroacetimidivorans]|uniref:Lipopolysaccharide biosynthesis protein RfbH n=1 Tax=Sinanaerobacter chloroacetimidivorans TaxID=2818044 RepID=A0A8J8B2E7_9FIRM|nr:lipopolysaccharide biosynthesis protein RfbH [Sinanaerobacter chloroacetimidivorans]MBR0598676.1 lipopolysaccharide biosynthesis protein RfbH [Sinanaerobacter chloroacetimidivorans]
MSKTHNTLITNTEQQLREEILEKTKQLYDLRKNGETFEPGVSRVHYAGRVFDEKEMQAMVDSVLDFWLTLGKRGNRFISDFLSLMGMRFGLVVNSGSSANLVAVSALCSPALSNPMKPGDEVITTALTFPTTLNPILQNGLIPVFVDVEEGTYNIDASKIEEAITEKTRAIMFAHTLGNPAEMDAITELANKYNLYVIEDTCDALDSLYDGKRCGTFGDISTFSFYAAHHITMGEGGALLTNNLNLYRQALSIRDWGRACYCQTGEENPMGACGNRFGHVIEGLPEGYDHKYVYSNIGYNLKPLDIQCAMGIEQLKKLALFSEKRKANFTGLYDRLKKHESFFILPRSLPKAEPSWFSMPLTLRDSSVITRRELVQYLEDHRIETRMLFAGNIIKQPAYKNISYRISGNLNHTEKVLNDTFFIGVYPGITPEMISYVSDQIDAFLEAY